MSWPVCMHAGQCHVNGRSLIADAQFTMLRELELNGHLPVHENEDADICNDELVCVSCEEDGDADDENTNPDRVWTRKRQLKPFTLLLIAKLRASMGILRSYRNKNNAESSAKRSDTRENEKE